MFHRALELQEGDLMQHYLSFQKAPLKNCMPRWCFLPAMRALSTPHVVKGWALQTLATAAEKMSAQSLGKVDPRGLLAVMSVSKNCDSLFRIAFPRSTMGNPFAYCRPSIDLCCMC